MARYRVRSEVEAVRWDGHNDAEVQAMFPNAIVRRDTFDEDLLPRLVIEHPDFDNVYVRAGEYATKVSRAGELLVAALDWQDFDDRFEEVD